MDSIKNTVTPNDVVNAGTSLNADVKQALDKASLAKVGESDEITKEVIENKIAESSDLISALESIGAMYKIPSTNILEDDSLDSIKVINDTIIAPRNKKSIENTKSIVCAIGAVLDYISQRIDSKLDDFQTSNCEKNRLSDDVRTQANPAKGNVINRYTDANGDEVIVYDSGLVDMNNTHEANELYDKLKADGNIPELNKDFIFGKHHHQHHDHHHGYFSDADDISNGVDMENVEDTSGDVDNAMSEIADGASVADSIQESADIIDMIDKFNGTTNLGYDLFQSYGFDYVKPMKNVFQEAASGKKKKSIDQMNIRHMRFDNTYIKKAITNFNKARAEQKFATKDSFDMKIAIDSPYWNQAIDCLNKQFNAHIAIKYLPNESPNVATLPDINDWKNHLTLSKSKGFQFNGLPIWIIITGKSMNIFSPDDKELFGQNLVAILLHEIFHNVAVVLRQSTANFAAVLSSTMQLASTAQSGREKRIILTNFVNSIDQFGDIKINALNKRAIIKRLALYSSLTKYENELKQLDQSISENPTNEEIDEYIKKYKKYIKDIKHVKNAPKRVAVFSLMVAALSGLLYFYNPFAAKVASVTKLSIDTIATISAFGGVWASGTALGYGLEGALFSLMDKEYSNTKYYEEYYCDLFAASYQLPPRFFIVKDYTPNDIGKEQLQDIITVERELHDLIYSKYPTNQERNYAAVKVAKATLKEKNLDKDIKKYLEWIVDNYSSLLDSDIEEIYTSNTFDPKEADDLDKHIDEIIKGKDVTVTESFNYQY